MKNKIAWSAVGSSLDHDTARLGVLTADQVLEHAKAAALSHVAEADAAAIAARLLQGEGVSE